MRLARWSHELVSCPNHFDIHLNSKYIAPIESKPLNGKCAVAYYLKQTNDGSECYISKIHAIYPTQCPLEWFIIGLQLSHLAEKMFILQTYFLVFLVI